MGLFNKVRGVYCQKKGCERDITDKGGVVYEGASYCSFEHAGIDHSQTGFYTVKKLQKAIMKEELTDYGSLEESVEQ